MSKYDTGLPEQYRPLSMWGYFGLQILFAVPIVGFIFLIIFSISGANINRRNFARSYFCGLIITLVIVGIIVAIAFALGGTAVVAEWISSLVK